MMYMEINTFSEGKMTVSMEKVNAKKRLMTKLESYTSAFRFLAMVCKIFNAMEDEKNLFPVTHLSSITPAFISLNKKGLEYSMSAFTNFPTIVTPKKTHKI